MIVKTTLKSVSRMNDTKDGNAVWILHTEAGDIRTKPDALFANGIARNLEPGEGCWIGKRVMLNTDEAGRAVAAMLRVRQREGRTT